MKRPTLSLVPLALLLAACGDGPTAPAEQPDPPPPTVASVAVVSAIGPTVAPGATGQMTAEALDNRGTALTRSFVWSSSNPSVATVSTTGVVTVLAAGEVTIQAEAEGITGDVALTSVEVDLDAIEALLDDPLADGLLATVGDSELEELWNDCSRAVGQGDITALSLCLVNVEADLATGDTETGPARAYLTLYAQAVGRALSAPATEV